MNQRFIAAAGSALRAGPGSGWSACLALPDGTTRTIEIEPLNFSVAPPASFDGWAAAALPAVMRAGGELRVAGPMSRGAIRNLTEYAEAWAAWRPGRFRRVEILADEVLDPPPIPPRSAVVAWSGSLRSTHVLWRRRAAAPDRDLQLKAALRVAGLSKDDRPPDADAAAPGLGAPLWVMRTNAGAGDWMDPEIGALPLVAAALQLACDDRAAGVHARRGPIAARMRYPRPGPDLPDLFSGGFRQVWAEGGGCSPVRMARDLAAAPDLAARVSDCARVPRHAPPCGRCAGCALVAVAFHAAGCARRASARTGRRIALRDPRHAAELEILLADWRDDADPLRRVLAARQRRSKSLARLAELVRWLRAASGLGPVWPR